MGAKPQYAAFVEFSIPVNDDFEVQLAGRYDHYSDFGSTTNPKVGLHWTPLDSLTVRGSWSQGFRAPSLAQIGLGASETSEFYKDTYRCEATGLDCEALDYNTEFSGNKDLEAEESESWNVGVIWAPDQKFDMGFDFWNITQDNKIDKQNRGEIYTAECNNQASTICVRLPAAPGQSLGVLDVIKSTYVNTTSQEVRGLDISAHYQLELDQYGDIKFGLDWSYLLNFEKDDLDYTGEYNYPEHRWLASSTWIKDAFSVNINVSYTGEFEDTPDADFDGNLDFTTNQSRSVESQFLVDTQVSYRVSDSVKVSLGASNLLDEEPPFAIGDGNNDLYGYAGGVHNPRGRYIYTKVSVNF